MGKFSSFLIYCWLRVCSVPGTVLTSGDSEMTEADFYVPSQTLANHFFVLSRAVVTPGHLASAAPGVCSPKGFTAATWPQANIKLQPPGATLSNAGANTPLWCVPSGPHLPPLPLRRSHAHSGTLSSAPWVALPAFPVGLPSSPAPRPSPRITVKRNYLHTSSHLILCFF